MITKVIPKERGYSYLKFIPFDERTDSPDMNYCKTLKKSKEDVATMCKAIEDMRTQTLQEGMREVAIRMLQAGKYALEEIAAISGLSIEKVKKLSETQTA